jgi:hypothetical protein
MQDSHGKNMVQIDIQSVEDIYTIIEKMEKSILEHKGKDSKEMEVLLKMAEAYWLA